MVDATEDAVERGSRRRYAMSHLVLKLRMRRSECDGCYRVYGDNAIADWIDGVLSLL